ncbi:MAG: zinc ribbon domain-containing protein [Saccharofermentanales bacterium]
MASQFCQFCGAGMEPDSTFCQACGKSQSAQAVQATPAQQTYSAPSQANAAPQQQYAPNTTPQYNHSAAYNAGMQAALDAPLKVGDYVGMFLLMCIPIVRFIMILVWGFGSSSNVNKKNFARAVMILFVIGLVLSIIFGIVFGAILFPLISDAINEYGNTIY